MKAVVFHGVGDIRLEDVDEPTIQEPTDAVVRITTSAICGTDLHMVRGTLPGMEEGTILGHEAVGVVEAVGRNVRNLREGDRVVVPSTIGCGYCSYCRAGYYAQCDNANPNGPRAGTAFFGGPASSGPFHGLQAEKARIPHAATGLVRIPDHVTDDQAILISDIFPTGWFGADMAEVEPGDTVAVWGCGPVGQFAIASALILDAGRVFAIDNRPARLEMARAQGAETIDYDREDPVETLLDLTGGIGVDRAIDAVGVDAQKPDRGPAEGGTEGVDFGAEVARVAEETNVKDGLWKPGDAPSQAVRWAVKGLAKAGTLSVIGVYSEAMQFFPFGEAMNRNLDVHMGNCHHRRYIPDLLRLTATGAFDPADVLTQEEPLTDAVEAFRTFDQRESGWVKVALDPGA